MPAPRNGQQPDPYHNARLLLGMIPEEIRKSASPAELADRLTRAQKVATQAGDERLDPLLRSQAKMAAQQILTAPAPPRAVPAAPGRTAAVRKAAEEDQPIAVFDADGNLIGICKPSALKPVAGAAKAPPAEDSDQVAKAARTGRAVVYDSRLRPYAVRAGNVQWPGGRVTKETAAAAPQRAARKAPGETRTGVAGDRVVVKAAGWRDVHNRAGQLVGVIKAADVIKPGPDAERRARSDTASFCNVFDAQGGRFGFAYRPNILPVRRGR